MEYLRAVLAVLLLTAFPSVYGGDCFRDNDINDCVVKAQQGYGKAQFLLGMMLENGVGILQDNTEAVRWYTKAAKQGDAGAQLFLGVMYYSGKGVPQDYKKAIKWYRKSAEHGHSHAQYKLGLTYSKGQGNIKDYVMAHMYWNIAAVSGNQNAIRGLKAIEKFMTPSQIEKAQDLAREWMRTHQ